MKETEVTVTINRKINLGNFENLDVSVTMSKFVEPSQRHKAAVDLGADIKQAINNILDGEVDEEPFNVQQFYRGTPIMHDKLQATKIVDDKTGDCFEFYE